MAFSLTWLPKVLLDAGVKVAEQPGWKTRGRGDVGVVKGIICHHTAGAKTGNMPSLGVVTNGRSDLPGPLAQLCLGRDGTFFVVAAGRCNHAGDVDSRNGSVAGCCTGTCGRNLPLDDRERLRNAQRGARARCVPASLHPRSPRARSPTSESRT